MFPGASARIYHNEEGEILGWDYESDPSEWYDPDDYLPDFEDDEDDEDDEDEGDPFPEVAEDAYLDQAYEDRVTGEHW